MRYTTQELSEITKSKLVGNPSLVITNISYDTRAIFSSKQNAFIAIDTERNSGKKFIINAIEKGVKVIISTNPIETSEDITWILVKDSISFLKTLAKHHFSNHSINSIGITGSNGKTIVKEWLFQTLNNHYNVVKSPKSFNSQLGLPISLLEINSSHDLGIFEVGISKPGEMELQATVFSPKIGVFTHLGSAHNSNFKDQKHILKEKFKLFQKVDTLIYQGDSPLVKDITSKQYSDKNLISFGLSETNNIHFIWKDKSKKRAIIFVYKECFETDFLHTDDGSISNILAVVATLHHLGFDFKTISQKISLLRNVEMRLESVEGENGNLIINDSFNLDLDSLYIAFQFIQSYQKQKRCLVLTDFLEGKDSSEKFYLQVAELCNQQNFNKIFLIGEDIIKYKDFFSTETHSFGNSLQLADNIIFKSISNSLILLKGARKFELEILQKLLEAKKHDAILEVNLDAILHNINIHKSILKPETKIMAMVKAYTYGLGGYEVAEYLQHHHIDYLGVAYSDEGVALRKNGITLPIIIMNPEQSSYASIIDYNLEPEIYSFRVLELFTNQLKQKGITRKYPIHIKIDTGMHRLGFQISDMEDLGKKLEKLPVKIESIFSHLSSADVEKEREFTLAQIKKFENASTLLIKHLKNKPILHILNSAGISNFSDYQYDMVRIGIGMIGLSSNKKLEKQMINAVTFKTVISQIRQIAKNESVGYSRKFIAKDAMKIAIIPVGYADGIPRLIGNGVGKVGIKGKLCNIIGNVCMDMLMVDATEMEISEGDEVIIFNGKPSLEDFSNYCNTIPYEVLTSISTRVKRKYIKT